MKVSNPQGKGLTPVLDAWRSAQPDLVGEKSEHKILSDYFTTLLVLSANFSFQPRRGVHYHLYWMGSGWSLSLISPGEWGNRCLGIYLGTCELLADMTWKLSVFADIQQQPALVEALQHFHSGFVDLVSEGKTLEEGLPYYAAELPYYRRLLAAGMASSLSRSIALAQLTGQNGQVWLHALQPRSELLLEQG